LLASKAYGIAHVQDLAQSETGRFGVPSELLFSYWKSFSYDLGREEQKGLRTFYGYAAEIGVIEKVPELRFWTKG
jgi:predicted solute-binding protein